MARRRAYRFAPPWQWGILRRRGCKQLHLSETSPDYEPMTTIYQALKGAGFRETYWQYVYPGQIGGLVKSPQNRLIELHARFFEGGMIYGEMEMGRSVLLHFINRRYYVNDYLVKMLGKRLSAPHARYLRISIEKYKSACEDDWPEWTAGHRFITRSNKMQIRLFTVLSDWRILAIIMLASVVSNITRGPIALPLLTALMIVVYLVAPRRS